MRVSNTLHWKLHVVLNVKSYWKLFLSTLLLTFYAESTHSLNPETSSWWFAFDFCGNLLYWGNEAQQTLNVKWIIFFFFSRFCGFTSVGLIKHAVLTVSRTNEKEHFFFFHRIHHTAALLPLLIFLFAMLIPAACNCIVADEFHNRGGTFLVLQRRTGAHNECTPTLISALLCCWDYDPDQGRVFIAMLPACVLVCVRMWV